MCRIISFGGRPYPVPETEIHSLQQVPLSGREFRTVPYLSGGDRVKVARGPLAGIAGVVKRFKNQDRLVISVDNIMKSVSLDVALSELTVLNAEG